MSWTRPSLNFLRLGSGGVAGAVPHAGEIKKVDERFVAPPHYDDTREHLFKFIQAVRTRQPANEDAEFGSNTATAAHLANPSYKKGGPFNWDPKNQVLS